MTQRKPGDYVINAELTDEQRERFVADCVKAGAKRPTTDYRGDYVGWQHISDVVMPSHGQPFYADNVTHEYKAQPMTQPELMHAIGDAMERNPEGWFREFEYYHGTQWRGCLIKQDVIGNNMLEGRVRPKPRTYTLHIEDMPEPLREEPVKGTTYYVPSPSDNMVFRKEWNPCGYSREKLRTGLCYPDGPTARDALEKLTKAMGGGQ